KRPSRLGRGLSSLMGPAVAVPTAPPPAQPTDSVPAAPISDVPRETLASSVASASDTSPTEHAELELVWLDLARVSPNPHQPRQEFDQDKLAELADSIRTHGVMQPVVVRPRRGLDRAVEGYELIAGERRWRAAQIAGLPALPAIVRDLDDEASAELALVENLQREDLNPIERAEALHALHIQFGLTHEQIGEKVGLKRSSVSNLLRLLELGPALRQQVALGTLTMGHARALLGATSPEVEDRALRVIEAMDGVTVRQAEDLIRYENAIEAGEEAEPPAWHPDWSSPISTDVPRGTPSANSSFGPDAKKSEWIRDLERQMSETLTTKVTIRPSRKKGSGQVTIHYHSLEDFDGLLDRLGVKPE
ncbi:MAG: ParB/RepB/Spo0J family partition protein, partial [Planctomycetota bacterium]